MQKSLANSADNFCCCIFISKLPVSQMLFNLLKPLKNNTFLILFETFFALPLIFKVITPSCVESEAIPYQLLVITVMIDVGEALRNWGFDLILTGNQYAGIDCQQR